MASKVPTKPFAPEASNAIYARFTQSMEYFGRVHERMYPLEAINYPQLFCDMQYLIDYTKRMEKEMMKLADLKAKIKDLEEAKVNLKHRLIKATKNKADKN